MSASLATADYFPRLTPKFCRNPTRKASSRCRELHLRGRPSLPRSRRATGPLRPYDPRVVDALLPFYPPALRTLIPAPPSTGCWNPKSSRRKSVPARKVAASRRRQPLKEIFFTSGATSARTIFPSRAVMRFYRDKEEARRDHPRSEHSASSTLSPPTESRRVFDVEPTSPFVLTPCRPRNALLKFHGADPTAGLVIMSWQSIRDRRRATSRRKIGICGHRRGVLPH
ncbi:cysteine desulfurase [Dendrobium catenatum]|uniref:Cysteine desulfurase n=1 Tax=Dendrobium catenatum TaxID=906689 RepID=A0A2I0XHG3_9ASPA|nr:cysteine desulfurase [Dendrobium catenatum]